MSTAIETQLRHSDRNTGHHLRQRGVSLVELMISMVIGLVLVGGAITVYVQSGNTYRTSDKVARLQEVGRYALDIVENDVRLAGMWSNTMFMPGGGGNITNSVADAIVSPNCGVNWVGDVTNYIDGRDNGAVLSATCTASDATTASDALIIRRSTVNTTAVDANKIQVQSTRMAATIFSGAAIPIEFDPAKSVTSDLIVRAYYVTQASATAPFILKRRTLAGTAGAFTFNEEDVIPGIQDLQVQFGVDTDNDNQADQYVNPGAVAGRRIVSARIWLLVVADDPEADFQDATVYAYANRDYGAAFTDQRRRVLLTKTIQIRNARLL
jgi:type IV pilus assembly protein PilW